MKVEYFVFVVFGLVAAHLLYKVVRNRGFRGAMFGAPVGRTVGEIALRSRGLVQCRLKVHTLIASSNAPQIGLEIAHSTVGSWHMTPVSLTADEARQLADALGRAARDAGALGAAG